MYTKDDLIFSLTRGSPNTPINGKGDFRDCINENFRLGPIIGIDASLVTSQQCVETANFTSDIWVRDGNPGGIGIDGDNTTTHTTTSPFKHLTGVQASQCHMATLYLKVKGNVPLPPELKAIEAYLPVWFQHTRKMISDPNWPQVKTINDLNIHFQSTVTGNTEATWAWDETYQDQIVAKATLLFAGATPQGVKMIFGKVPHPVCEERWVTDAQSGAWDNLGQRKVKGVVWHRMVGTLMGTDGWFRRGVGVSDGLTEYGIGTANVDGAQYDGVIFRWNDSTGAPHPGVSANRSPWASGPVNKPYGDGLAFLQDNNMDFNVVNRDEAAIEISGNYTDPISDKAKQSIIKITAYYADQAQIPWSQFPLVNGKSYSFVRWHQEFTIGTGKVCPGQVVMDATNELIQGVKDYLKSFQESQVTTPGFPVTPIYARPSAIPKADGFDKQLNNVIFYAIVKNVHIIVDQAKCYSSADPNAAETRAPLKKGQVFTTQWVVKGSDGLPWWVTPHGSRIPVSSTDGWIKI